MSYKLIIIAFFAIMTLELFSQRSTMELTFTAVDSTTYVQLDSIRIMNRTQGGDTVLYWPDTVLSFNYVGLPETTDKNTAFQVFQNYPNPVVDQTTISIHVPEKDEVSIIITDILGRVIVESEWVLNRGKHSFQFTPGLGNLYFFTAMWQGKSVSIKIVSYSSDCSACLLEYLGGERLAPTVKSMDDIREFFFSPGNELLYIGFADGLESGVLDTPEENQTYTFQFATNIPCPGTPTVDYEGQVYNTIQIFSQCWLKENLNVGVMINGTIEQSDNGILEKYCYNNEPANCAKYGGLYEWWEMMQYTNQQGTRGICPPDWHLPMEEEWKVLEGAVDSECGIGDTTWYGYFFRGYDAGMNLKTTSGWYVNGNGLDLFGFSGLPGGKHLNYDGYFHDVGKVGYWWTSTECNVIEAWLRPLSYGYQGVGRWPEVKWIGLSIRCLKDY
jgi:uncharacterized protein (TIGR02145 family)